MRTPVDEAALEQLRTIVQDQHQLTSLLQSLFHEWLAEIPAHFRTPESDRLLPLAVDALARFNTQWMFYYCESPIERTVVGCLLALHARSSPLSLVMTPNFLHGPDPLETFRQVREDMKRFTSEDRFTGSAVAFLDHIKHCVDNSVIMPATFDFMRDHYMFYNLLDLSSAFHLSLQPAMKQIEVAGHTIRPDLLFWSPSRPDFRIVVECDGFDYHSDRAAFTRDRQRDRRLRQQGFEVVRFSGSEIYRDPAGVAIELADIVEAHHDRRNET